MGQVGVVGAEATCDRRRRAGLLGEVASSKALLSRKGCMREAQCEEEFGIGAVDYGGIALGDAFVRVRSISCQFPPVYQNTPFPSPSSG